MCGELLSSTPAYEYQPLEIGLSEFGPPELNWLWVYA